MLTRLTDVDAPQSGASLPDRLSHWLDWKQAIALSTALDGKPAEPADDLPAFGQAAEDEYLRSREALVQAIANDRAFVTAGQREAQGMPSLDAANDYAPLRQRYIALQRKIQATTGSLRGDLRDMLAQASPGMARLAEVDAVMEMALSPREQSLLSKLPTLLGEYFDSLRQRAQTNGADPSAAWLDGFRKDMQSVLLAELDVRFQPVEGLLAALRAS
ncbi:MAG TPA: DUF3348 domain-containing protein [Luteibacter sp.]|uniref:DUF3348 domain-containing protein n=1 Tax=Luteibacter sp. TaxID=1886636 RepID=UPI002B9E8566|nr:DUF3348 domain-containing protein [Luteibacter sp.]HVI56646.1 DUF3348 domain-containing protein [Luteibacter sp.]